MQNFIEIDGEKVPVTISFEGHTIAISIEGYGCWDEGDQKYKSTPVIKIIGGEYQTLDIQVVADINDDTYEDNFEEYSMDHLETPRWGMFKVFCPTTEGEGIAFWVNIPSEINSKNIDSSIFQRYCYSSLKEELSLKQLMKSIVIGYRIQGKEVFSDDVNESIDLKQMAADVFQYKLDNNLVEEFATPFSDMDLMFSAMEANPALLSHIQSSSKKAIQEVWQEMKEEGQEIYMIKDENSDN